MNSTILNDGNNSIVWSEHSSIICEQLLQLFIHGQLVDVAISVNHNEIFAHRAILGAASPVLLSQLQNCSGPNVQLQLDALVEGCSIQDAQGVIELIYYGKVNVPQHRLSSFLNVAHCLQLVGFYDSSMPNSVVPRSVSAPRPSLHVLPLPDAQPTFPTPEQFIPQLTLGMPPTFAISDSQQLLDEELPSQAELSHIANNLNADAPPVTLNNKFNQGIADKPKY